MPRAEEEALETARGADGSHDWEAYQPADVAALTQRQAKLQRGACTRRSGDGGCSSAAARPPRACRCAPAPGRE